MTKELEYCCICDEPTERAGRLDDSLYIDDDGPFCEECFVQLTEKKKQRDSFVELKNAFVSDDADGFMHSLNIFVEMLGFKR